nr:hypothetical protein 78 [bacterium]
MRKSLLKQRTHLVEGKPARRVPPPKSQGRRGVQLVEDEVDEYDEAYHDFFEFQRDLDEIEAVNEQQRRQEIYGVKDEFGEPQPAQAEKKSPKYIIMEEDEEEEFSPIIMEDFEEIPSAPQFKRCRFIKSNGEQCKRQAPKKSDLCAAHRKK